MDQRGRILMKKYELGKLLGQGTFGKVYIARNIKTQDIFAIKVINKEVLRVEMIKQIKREIMAMRLVRHPNVVHLFEVMASKAKIYFVMEYVEGGDLLRQVKKGKLNECTVWKYFQQLIIAVDFCHSRGVTHRDLKLENLLLDENGNLKVTDFSLSALSESKQQDGLLHTGCGTPDYVAPEVISKRGYDGAKADIWSCGVILFALMAGYFPFRDLSLIGTFRKITQGDFKCPKYFPPEVCRLLSGILDPNPDSRISISEIMQNSWFKMGPTTNSIKIETENKELLLLDANGIFDNKEDFVRRANQNAFNIISLSVGLDLSGFFEEKPCKEETWFTSKKPALSIVSKLQDIGQDLRLRMKKEKEGILTYEGLKEGKKGLLLIDAEISEITPTFHLVWLKKSGGDTFEYQELLEKQIKPSLKDIVWVWQEDQQ